MYKKVIQCEDFDGNMQTYTMYFNLTKKELMKMDASFDGGILPFLDKLNKEKNPKDLMAFVDSLIDTAYGVKTDSNKFIKSKEILDDFKASPQYDEYYYQMLTTEGEADEFIDRVFPRDLMAQALEELKKNPKMLEEAGFESADVSLLTNKSSAEEKTEE